MLKQALPPHWRGSWRESLIRTLTEPIIEDYNEFYQYIYSTADLVNRNSQVLVMEVNLNRIAHHLTRLIYFEDGPTNGSFIVNIPAADPALLAVQAYLDSFPIAGKSYTLNEY